MLLIYWVFNKEINNCLDSNQLFTDTSINHKEFQHWYSFGVNQIAPNMMITAGSTASLNEISTYLNQNYWVWDQNINSALGSYEGLMNWHQQSWLSTTNDFPKYFNSSGVQSNLMQNNMIYYTKVDYDPYFNNKKFAENKFSTLENRSRDFINEDEEDKSSDLSYQTQQQISDMHHGRSRRRLYYLRQDVIAKIIFRSLRKYYLRDFKAFFNFSKCRSDQNSDTQGEMIRQINRYLAMKFGYTKYHNLAIFLLAIMDVKEKFIQIGPHLKSLKESITGLLYSYNKLKMVNIVKNPEFAMLLLFFLNQRDVLQQIIKHRNNQDLVMAYTEQIQCFKSMCTLAIRE